MDFEIRKTDFDRYREFIEEGERVMYVDSGLGRADEHSRLARLAAKSVENCRRLAIKGEGVGFCAVSGETSIGYAFSNYNRSEKRGFITSVYVAEAYRDQGVGRALMEALIHELDASGIEDVGLAVTVANAGAIHLYVSLGFEVKRHIMRKQIR